MIKEMLRKYFELALEIWNDKDLHFIYNYLNYNIHIELVFFCSVNLKLN